MKRYAMSLIVLSALTAVTHAQNKRDIAVRTDKERLSGDTSWIYDDLNSAFAEAAKTNRPLMIVFR